VRVDGADLSGVHKTAFGTALMRAWHVIGDGEPKIIEDDLGMALAGFNVDQLRELLATREVPSTAVWILRARFCEDRLHHARQRGVAQYVILGAGLDTFALRHVDEIGDLIVFEVDDPPLQAWKKRRIDELGLAVPTALRFAPCDFETMSVADALAQASFRENLPAFVSWLGVTQYLSEDAIAETLRWAASLAPGSEIVLTFVVPTDEAESWKQETTRNLGEVGFETFFTPEEIASVVTRAGLHVTELLTTSEANRRYFSGRNDGLRASTSELVMVAGV
jgi:methyltransferase (TIGR00027 family)